MINIGKIRKNIFKTRYFGFIIGLVIFLILLGFTYGTVLIKTFEMIILNGNFNFRLDIIGKKYGIKKTQEGVSTITYNPKVSNDIVLVGIDSKTLDRFGKWPFERYFFANLIKTYSRIKDENERERALFLDVNFIERDTKDPVNDVLLIESISENSRVFLEAFFAYQEFRNDEEEENQLKRLQKFIDKFGVISNNQLEGDWKMLDFWRSVECPLKPVIDVAKGYGNVTYRPDRDDVFRRQPLLTRFSQVIQEIKLQDLKPQYPDDPVLINRDNFERLVWNDKRGYIHDIPYPLTEDDIEKLKRNMLANAIIKQDIIKGEEKDEIKEYYIIKKYKDYIIPSIPLTLALEYFNKNLSDIEIVLGEYIRIPNPQKFNTESGKWEKLIDKPPIYEIPEVISKEEYENDILQKVNAGQKNILLRSYNWNSIFNKFILNDKLNEKQMLQVQNALLQIDYKGLKNKRQASYKDEIRIPIDKTGNMLINFMGKPSSTEGHQTFRVKSFYQEARDPGPDKDNWRRTKHAAGKILIVGMFATGLGDEKPTPYGIMYGPEINANAINTIIMDNFLIQAHPAVNIIILFCTIMLISFLVSRLPTVWSLIASLFVLLIYYIISCWIIFEIYNYIIITSAPILSGILAFISIVTYRVMTEEREKKEIKGVFAKYVNPTLVENILENPPELGGVDKDITVFFSDIRGFTSLSERMTPQALVNHLNNYLTAMTDIILAYRGTLDKYVGDEIMAFWGAPLPEPQHALIACKSALKQMEVLKKLNKEWTEELRINIGIGLNTGTMTVGNMGSTGRMNYTLMGDMVNLGARLEGTNKLYKTNIIISEYTYGFVKDEVIVRELDNIRVKGKQKSVLIYELVDMVDSYDVIPEKV